MDLRPDQAVRGHQRGLSLLSTALEAALRDLTLSHAWTADGALFLEFGALSPSRVRRRDGSSGNPVGEVSACFYGGWQIGSADGPSLPGDIVGLRLASGTITGVPPELDLIFETGARVVSLSAAGEAPDWAVADHRGPSAIWYAVEDGLVRASDGGPSTPSPHNP